MNIDNLKELIEAVSKSDIAEFKYKDSEMSVALSKQAKEQVVQVASVVAETPAVAATVEPVSKSEMVSGNVVKSPLVGTAYVSATEGGAPLVSVGDEVSVGQPLIIIEAMKLMNEITSEYSGVVKEILVENGQMVEFDQPLFVIG